MAYQKNNIRVLLTCYNRSRLTTECIRNIKDGNPDNDYDFVIVDGGSIDDTVSCLSAMREAGVNIRLLIKQGFYYSQGMRAAMLEAVSMDPVDYVLLMNDDVRLYDHAIDDMLCNLRSSQNGDTVLVGACQSLNGGLSYGGICYGKRGVSYRKISPCEDTVCDTFNANCVLIPWKIFKSVPPMDSRYIHALGDFDYGFSIKNKGFHIHVNSQYIGLCENNDVTGEWTDKSLSCMERIKAKESVKGSPFKIWFYFLKKNFGITKALIYSVTPYIRILIRK